VDESTTAAALAASPEVRQFLAQPGWAAFVGTGTGTVLWASPNCGEVLGHRAEDLVGRNAWTILIAPEDIRPAAELRTLMSEGDTQIWARYKTGGGGREWFRVEILGRRGLYVAALKRETDPALHKWGGRLRRA
jgi:PAS domain S-box-containing protein